MRKGEEGEISDEAILSDLLSAGYVEELEHIITSKETENEEDAETSEETETENEEDAETSEETVPKKKTGKKKATK